MISRDDNSTRNQAADIFMKGLMDVAKDEFTNAVIELERALKLFDRVEKRNDDDKRSIAQILYVLGSVSMRLYIERTVINLPWFSFDLTEMKERLERAIIMLEEIAENDRSDKDNRDLACCYAALGKVYAKMNEYQKTLDCNTRALENFGFVKSKLTDEDHRTFADIYRISGEAYQGLENWSRASMSFNNAVASWKKVQSALSDNELSELAACYHFAGSIIRKQTELDIARAYFISEIETIGQINVKNIDIIFRLQQVFSELRDISPAVYPEREIFEFAAEVFGANFFNRASFEKLNNILYMFSSSPSWQTARIQESIERLLDIICLCCKLPVFPSSPLKQYLLDENHFNHLRKKLYDISNMKSCSIDNKFYDLLERVHHLEAEVTDLREQMRFFKPVKKEQPEQDQVKLKLAKT